VLSSKAIENASKLAIFSFKFFLYHQPLFLPSDNSTSRQTNILGVFSFQDILYLQHPPDILYKFPFTKWLRMLSDFFAYYKAGFDTAVVLRSLLVEHLLLGIQVLQLLYFILS
jgi:hypothetical protein